MILTNPKIKEYLAKKDKIVTKAREISAQIEELETERNRLAMQVQKVKDKVIPLINQEVNPQLKEFEMIGTVLINDQGEVEAEIYDFIEEKKREFLEAKAKEEEKEVKQVA